jgi:hypothetical protein
MRVHGPSKSGLSITDGRISGVMSAAFLDPMCRPPQGRQGHATRCPKNKSIRKQRTGLRHAIRVLSFANDGASMGLRMNWVTPSHLEVVFRDDPKVLYYQVIRTSGVEISVRDL